MDYVFDSMAWPQGIEAVASHFATFVDVPITTLVMYEGW